MAKDFAFMFYPGNWLGGTMGMSFEQKGCYLELLVLQFNNGKFTELEAKQLLSICFTNAWPMLKRKFNTDGTYFWNERLQTEMDKRLKYIESRRLSGLTPKKQKAYAKRTQSVSKDKDINKNNINIEFEVFWNLYEKKEDRIKCENKWISLTDEERQKCIDAIPAYVRVTPDKQFRKNPATYLNNKSWNNEIIKPVPKDELQVSTKYIKQ